MRVGIDLLWVRPGKCGGTESFIRNLLYGFGMYGGQNEYVLFAARDNVYSFQEYEKYANLRLKECPVCCADQPQRILWENMNLDIYAQREKTDIMFIPVYSKPYSRNGRIPYITVIHDLQAIHYPQYFSNAKRMFFKHAWKYACRTSANIVTDSDYCREDILTNFNVLEDKVRTIYIPVCGTKYDDRIMAGVLEKYGVSCGQYDYCVSSLLPHKNLDTILKVTAELKANGTNEKVVLSGVGGDSEEFLRKIKRYGIEGNIIQTGFISNEERDCLYRGCKLFLFPSVFEGFGMPPVEAMMLGKRVVMTKESCLFEVTDGKAVYVEDPYSAEDWIRKMETAVKLPEKTERFPQYELANITGQYVKMFQEILE